MQEVRIDLRTQNFERKSESIRSNQLCFKINNTMPKTPECENGDWVDTEWMFRNIDSDYKVIIVGDAAMAPEELYSDTGNYH